jgi:hypothetical protein
LRAARRIVAKLSVVVLIAVSMTTSIAAADIPSHEITAEQFLREVASAHAGTNEFPSTVSRVSDAVNQQCCKICTTGKACGDTCIVRDKTCQIGAGSACDG